MRICPHLGIENEPNSRFVIATSANFCHKANPVKSVKLEYQSTVCFSDAHQSCPVYQPDWDGPLPNEAKGGRHRRRRKSRNSRIPRGLFIFLVLIVVGVGFWLGNPDLFSIITNRDGTTVTPLSAAVETAIPSQTSLPTVDTVEATATELPVATHTTEPTKTPLPTSTATVIPTSQSSSLSPTPSPQISGLTPGPSFQTPFGPQDAYILHRISEGESMPVVAKLYGTNFEVIFALNEWVDELGLRPNRVIVLMPGITDPQGLVSLTVHFTQEETTLFEFSVNQGVRVDDLRYYNQLGNADYIPAGRWLIFPFLSETPTPTVTAEPTPDLSRALSDPFGPNDEYILHQVALGDSLAVLEKLYLTSIEMIQSINVIKGSIQLEQVLVIIPGQKDVIENPRFSVVNIDETISIEKFASSQNILYADIIFYNNLTQGQDLEAGTWIIHPHMEESE